MPEIDLTLMKVETTGKTNGVHRIFAASAKTLSEKVRSESVGDKCMHSNINTSQTTVVYVTLQ